MNWIIYALGTAISLALADLFIKLAAGKISNSLAILIYGSCTFVAGLSWVLWQAFQQIPIYAKTQGIFAALGVGISFSMVTIGMYTIFSLGEPVSVVSPFVRLGGLLLVSFFGIVILRESFTLRYMIGVLLAFAGIYLIITR